MTTQSCTMGNGPSSGKVFAVSNSAVGISLLLLPLRRLKNTDQDEFEDNGPLIDFEHNHSHDAQYQRIGGRKWPECNCNYTRGTC